MVGFWKVEEVSRHKRPRMFGPVPSTYLCSFLPSSHQVWISALFVNHANCTSCLVSLSPSANEYGLFLADDDPKKGVWLESGKTLEHYLLRQGVRLPSRQPGHSNASDSFFCFPIELSTQAHFINCSWVPWACKTCPTSQQVNYCFVMPLSWCWFFLIENADNN